VVATDKSHSSISRKHAYTPSGRLKPCALRPGSRGSPAARPARLRRACAARKRTRAPNTRRDSRHARCWTSPCRRGPQHRERCWRHRREEPPHRRKAPRSRRQGRRRGQADPQAASVWTTEKRMHKSRSIMQRNERRVMHGNRRCGGGGGEKEETWVNDLRQGLCTDLLGKGIWRGNGEGIACENEGGELLSARCQRSQVFPRVRQPKGPSLRAVRGWRREPSFR